MTNNYQSQQISELQQKLEALGQHIMSQQSNSKGEGYFVVQIIIHIVKIPLSVWV